MLPSRQGGHQHDEGGLRQVEIGDEGVQHLESVPRIDKDISPPGALDIVPSSAEKLSTVRQEVVPTQMTRPPFRFVSLMVSAVSWEIIQNSECISWSVISSAFTGRKVPRPTWSVT